MTKNRDYYGKESQENHYPKRIKHDLIPQLFKLNNWDATITPQFKYGKVEKQDIDAISKYLQRAGSQGLISQDAKTVNWVHSQLGMPLPFDPDGTSVEEVRQNVTTFSSNSGAGMKEGLPGGVGKADGSSGDSSTSNGENT